MDKLDERAETPTRVDHEPKPGNLFIRERVYIGYRDNELRQGGRPTPGEQDSLRLLKDAYENVGYTFMPGPKGVGERYIGSRLRYLSQRELRDEVDAKGGDRHTSRIALLHYVRGICDRRKQDG